MMDDRDDILAVVVTHASAASIDPCLVRLRAARGVAQIRVIDNGSRDATVDIVSRHASLDARIRFVANPDNPGFAVACNQGARAGDAAWIAFVNPDCLVEPETLARLREHAANGDVLVGADLVDERGVHDPATRRRDPDFLAMLRTPSARDLSLPRDSAALQPVDAVSGALLLLPRELFERVGGFDEAYRLHAEDLDLCRRVRDAGGRVAIANDVVATHVRGVSSRARPLFVEWHKHRGLARYFLQFEAPHRSASQRLAVLAAIWLRFPLAALRALAGRG